ncbi:MAG: hypothetical protein VW985_13775, partial [Gammaproteobacteria bacterium]
QAYEIHAGISRGEALRQPLINSAGGADGAISADGQIAASYWHGLLDQPESCLSLLDWAGLPAGQQHRVMGSDQSRETALNRLTDCLEQTLNWPLLDEILGITENPGVEN